MSKVRGFNCTERAQSYRCLMVISRTNGGSFVSVLDITNIIAKLQWTCRAMIFEELLRRIKPESESESEAESDVWADLSRYICQDYYTAFNSIGQAMHLASAIVYGTSSLLQITWLDETHLRWSIHIARFKPLIVF